MKNEFLEKLENLVKNYKDIKVLKSTKMNEGISYEMLWKYSGKIYNYLKKHGIGKEDIVFICLSRGARIVISMVGVWRAGAAFTIMENGSSPERIKYIKEDCKCKLFLDEEMFYTMIAEDSIDGYEEIDMHDASHIVYTSGTTGNPKGVLQEHGKIMEGVNGYKAFTKDTEIGSELAIISPMNFTVALLLVQYALYWGKCIYIVSYDVGKNPALLSKFLLDEKISEVFMPPSVVKLYKDVSPYLKNVIVAGDVSSNLFIKGPNFINNYGSSESCNTVASFLIDKPYEITPVGKNMVSLDVKILDENDIEVKKGEIGEICFKNIYTRGYLNLPEKTKEVFRNGYYHMGDLGYIDKNDNIVICGRRDDMIKINGNRIEPVEIELNIRAELNINNVMVKGFKNEREYIAAYLLRNELKDKGLITADGEHLNVDQEELNSKLAKKLPYYMIPTYYVVLDSFPVNANGKPSRKDLKEPDITKYVVEYVEPTNEIEKEICDCFAKALKKEKVGIKDDFYLIGGDSLKSMLVLNLCKLQELTIGMLYKYKTAERIAKYYKDNVVSKHDDIDIANEKELHKPQYLLPEMIDVVDYQFIMPKALMWNIHFLLELKEDIDINIFAKAVDKVFKAHPALNTILYFDEDDVKQKYAIELYKDIEIEYLNEDDFNKISTDLVKPFMLINNLLHRKKLYVTEKSKYFFCDIHHLVTDGTSTNLFFEQIGKCYEDDNYIIPKDYYYLEVSNYFKTLSTKNYDNLKKYYIEQFNKLGNNSILLNKDYESNKLELGLFERELTISKDDFHNNEVYKEYSDNVIYIAACLIAMAKYNNINDTGLQWIFNGRETKISASTIGLLYKSLPVFSFIDNNMNIRSYLDEINRQVDLGISNNEYKVSNALGEKMENTLFCLYQKNISNLKLYSYIKKEIKMEKNHEVEASDAYAQVEFIDNEGENVKCKITYSKSHYKSSSIEKLYNIIDNLLNNDLKLS